MTVTEAPRFNHVAISVPAEMLDEEGREHLARFYREVFGFEPHDVMTIDRKRLVIGAGRVDQFIYIIANDEPMTCPRMDHWGMSVQSEEQLDDYLERARKFKAEDDRVEIIEKAHRRLQLHVAHGVLRALPAPDDARGPVLRLQGRRTSTEIIRRSLRRRVPAPRTLAPGERSTRSWRASVLGGAAVLEGVRFELVETAFDDAVVRPGERRPRHGREWAEQR
jgi:hypothetical protein